MSGVFKEPVGRSDGRAYPAAFVTAPRAGDGEEWERLGSPCSREWGPEAWHLFARWVWFCCSGLGGSAPSPLLPQAH